MIDQNSSKRIVCLDGLRVFATLAVIFLHVSAGYWGSEEVVSSSWMAANLYDGMVRWCVPVFVMISGALLLDPGKETMIGARIRRVLVPLVIWSAVYSVVGLYHGGDWTETVRDFFLGHYHLWYLYMLIGLYLILPLLKKIVENEKLEMYFLLLAFLFNFVIPQIVGTLELVAPTTGGVLESMVEKIDLQLVLGYSGYFVLGHWLYHRIHSKKLCMGIYLAGSLGVMLTVVLTFAASVSVGHAEKLFFSYFSCNVLFASMAVFLVFCQIRYSPGIAVCMRELSKYTFGIFLVHPLILEAISGLQPEVELMLRIPITALTIFLLSLAITILLKSILWVGKVCV